MNRYDELLAEGERLRKRLDSFTPKEEPISKQELLAINKHYGVMKMAERINKEGDSGGITELELVKFITEEGIEDVKRVRKALAAEPVKATEAGVVRDQHGIVVSDLYDVHKRAARDRYGIGADHFASDGWPSTMTTPEQAFARYYLAPENHRTLKSAIMICKRTQVMEVPPVKDIRQNRPTERLLGGGITYDQVLKMNKGQEP